MIVLDTWKIRTQDQIVEKTIKTKYAHAYIGNELNTEPGNPNIDDRLQWMKSFIGKSAASIHTATYDIENSQIEIESNETKTIHSVNNLSAIGIKSEGRILIDATSLLLPELLYLMYWANITQQHFDVMYVEPSGYKERPYKPKIGSHRLDYSLSDDGIGICMLPRYALPMEGSHLVIALGYEGHRFGSLLISDEINPANISGILGVPPFELGMEKNSYARNYSIMEEARKTYDANFLATAANDPLQNYQLLKTIFQSEAASLKPNRKLHLAPFGTKPVALHKRWTSQISLDTEKPHNLTPR